MNTLFLVIGASIFISSLLYAGYVIGVHQLILGIADFFIDQFKKK